MAFCSDSRVFRGSLALASEPGGNEGRPGRGGAVCVAGEVAGIRGSECWAEADTGAEEGAAEGAEEGAEAAADVEAESTCSVLVRGV